MRCFFRGGCSKPRSRCKPSMNCGCASIEGLLKFPQIFIEVGDVGAAKRQWCRRWSFRRICDGLAVSAERTLLFELSTSKRRLPTGRGAESKNVAVMATPLEDIERAKRRSMCALFQGPGCWIIKFTVVRDCMEDDAIEQNPSYVILPICWGHEPRNDARNHQTKSEYRNDNAKRTLLN